MHQFALVNRGHSIISCGQMKWFGHDVNDKSIKVAGGCQHIKTADGCIIPLIMQNGLPLMGMCPPTHKELRDLPQTILSQLEAESVWDLTVLDFNLKESDEQWFNAAKAMEKHPYNEIFDECSYY